MNLTNNASEIILEGEVQRPGEFHFKPSSPRMWAKGSEYGPLQTDGYVYLCPDCGGYGEVGKSACSFCLGNGIIELWDERVIANKEYQMLKYDNEIKNNCSKK